MVRAGRKVPVGAPRSVLNSVMIEESREAAARRVKKRLGVVGRFPPSHPPSPLRLAPAVPRTPQSSHPPLVVW